MPSWIRVLAVIILVVATGACARRQPPATPQPPPDESASRPPDTSAARTTPPPAPAPERVEDRQPVAPVEEDSIANRSLDDLNRDSPLRPAFFVVDSSELDDAGRSVVTANAEVMKKYPTWVVTIEGHADERGTAEYNLALGERRALAVKTYMLSLGIAGDRLRTVSYGKEFPFDPGHDESAWSKNRRAHFVITSK